MESNSIACAECIKTYPIACLPMITKSASGKVCYRLPWKSWHFVDYWMIGNNSIRLLIMGSATHWLRKLSQGSRSFSTSRWTRRRSSGRWTGNWKDLGRHLWYLRSRSLSGQMPSTWLLSQLTFKSRICSRSFHSPSGPSFHPPQP